MWVTPRFCVWFTFSVTQVFEFLKLEKDTELEVEHVDRVVSSSRTVPGILPVAQRASSLSRTLRVSMSQVVIHIMPQSQSYGLSEMCSSVLFPACLISSGRARRPLWATLKRFVVWSIIFIASP